MQVQYVLRWPWAISIVLISHLASAQLAFFSRGFLEHGTEGLEDFGVEHDRGAPNRLQLIRRQAGTCPSYAPIACSAGRGCCEAGKYCCTNFNFCCDVDKDCTPGGCCPKGYETCGRGACYKPGSVCCVTGACDPGYVCLTSPAGKKTCCLPGMIACEGFCCYEGTKCSTNFLFCDRIPASIPTLSSASQTGSSSPSSQPSPTRGSSVSTDPTNSPKPSKLKCKSTPSYSVPNARRTAIPGSVDGYNAQSAARATLSTRQDESSNGFEEFCETNEGKIPVMLFPWFPGETDELINSTCRGISKFGGTDELLITWAGDGKQGANSRRRKNCPRGYCFRIGEKHNPHYGRVNECDEFPPASSLESAQGASHVMCIDILQNQLGGKLIQGYSRLYRLQPNQKFIIRVIPTCGQFASATNRKRSPVSSANHTETIQNRDVTDQFSESNSTWLQDRRPGADSGVGWVFGSLPDLSMGTYNISFRFRGPIVDLSIFDSAGLEYLQLSTVSSEQSFNFTVVEGLPLGVAAYAREDAKINLSYNGQRIPNSMKSSLAVSIRGHLEVRWVNLGFLILALFRALLKTPRTERV